MSKMLRVMKCSENRYWYANRIGEYFKVPRNKIEDFVVVEHPNNTQKSWACVPYEDCIVFEEEQLEDVESAYKQLEDTLRSLSLPKD